MKHFGHKFAKQQAETAHRYFAIRKTLCIWKTHYKLCSDYKSKILQL